MIHELLFQQIPMISALLSFHVEPYTTTHISHISHNVSIMFFDDDENPQSVCERRQNWWFKMKNPWVTTQTKFPIAQAARAIVNEMEKSWDSNCVSLLFTNQQASANVSGALLSYLSCTMYTICDRGEEKCSKEQGIACKFCKHTTTCRQMIQRFVPWKRAYMSDKLDFQLFSCRWKIFFPLMFFNFATSVK